MEQISSGIDTTAVSPSVQTVPECSHSRKHLVEGKWKCMDCGLGRPGREPGSKNKETVEKEVARKAFEDRILANLHELMTAQLNIARGASYMFRIEEDKKTGHKEHILVDDPEEIKRVLDECEGTGMLDDQYYYITTKAPENRALDSLLDRVFGRATQKTEGAVIVTHQIVGMRVIKEVEGKEVPERLPASPSDSTP